MFQNNANYSQGTVIQMRSTTEALKAEYLFGYNNIAAEVRQTSGKNRCGSSIWVNLERDAAIQWLISFRIPYVK
jgi:hypothetical protein